MGKASVTTNDGRQVMIAESDETIRTEGNYYFPPESVNKELLFDSGMHTTSHWKGEASYKTVKIGDEEWTDGVWYYPEPKPGSIDIVKTDFTNYFAFWRGVEVSS